MGRRAYITKKLGPEARMAIATANQILLEYSEQGYDLTLRQLFYQHVARGLLPNTERAYKRLGTLVSDGRMTGRIDWNHIVDRTRNLRSVAHWDDPAHAVDDAASRYRIDLWEKQPRYVEVWIEKDALVGVIQKVCQSYDVPYFSCRGYTSQSEMWRAAQRLLQQVIRGKDVTVLHLGDHDPSGLDMTRDVWDRLSLIVGADYARYRAKADGIDIQTLSTANIQATVDEGLARLQVERIALTMDQIDEYEPPPNPAKVTDSRSAGYTSVYGDSSWELDALEPPVLEALIRDHTQALLDADLWLAALNRQAQGTTLLWQAADSWDEIVEYLNGD